MGSVIDVDNLLTVIKSAIDAAGGTLAALVGKVVLGPVKEGMARPYCAATIVGDRATGLFGGGSINYCPVEFAVYADTEAVANALAKALVVLLHGCSLTLTGQTFLRAMKTANPRVKQDGRATGNRVYRAATTIEFMVQV